ncbi:hypothetical protein GCM10007063_28650 [Lentibacillus kapialis]|uniref:Uncharacterized protein n=1 Tax=Lentibacillus kapialis TaxID=340214 RepID=A0A917Q088_9BACI|nr:hypothetical protein [Lentibacillus kapialis]GGK04593.1 hypothetical protein GCM10007063_28650 [Lentibacillus kapialis]
MSVRYYHELCCKYKGRPVRITTRDGEVHRGTIQNVDHHRVFIQPFHHRNIDGFGYGFYSPGYGYRPGFAYGIALGAIGTLALLPFFYW